MKILAWGAAISDQKDIQVNVEKGFVTLSGTSNGIFSVQPRTLSACCHPSKNESIRRGIMEALKRNAEVEADSIEIDVSGTRVTLHGKV